MHSAAGLYLDAYLYAIIYDGTTRPGERPHKPCNEAPEMAR